MVPAKKKAAKQEAVLEEETSQEKTSSEAGGQDSKVSSYKLEEVVDQTYPLISEIEKCVKRGDTDGLAALYCSLHTLQNLYAKLCFYDDVCTANKISAEKGLAPGEGEEDDEDESDNENPEKFLERIAGQTEKELELEKKHRSSLEDYMKADYCR